jgi:hypothetical protein
VLAVEACPKIEAGPGRVVTGIFRHRAGRVYDLRVEGEPESLGITGTHLIWSADRQAWVSVVELREGERLRALNGETPRVLTLAIHGKPEPVYNIEVEGDHCYRVGQQGLLVHNASVRDKAIWDEQPELIGEPPQRNRAALGHCQLFRIVIGDERSGGLSPNGISYEDLDDKMVTPPGTVWGNGKRPPQSGAMLVETYMGRPQGFRARLTTMTPKRGSKTDFPPRIDPPGWRANAGANRGHLLANSLGGAGGVKDLENAKKNLITQAQSDNVSKMPQIESVIRNELGNVKEFWYQLQTVYRSNSKPTPYMLKVVACAKIQTKEGCAWLFTKAEFWTIGFPIVEV